MRGRKPQPTNLKTLKGVRASRINKNEPAFEKAEFAPPPKNFTSDAKKFWNEVYPMLLEKDVLKKTDIPAFRVLCQAYSDTQVLRSTAKLKTFMSCAAEFGLTPSSRSRLTGGVDPKAGSAIKDFLLKGFRNGSGR